MEQHKQEMDKMRHEMETANETITRALLEDILDRDAEMKKTQDNMDALKQDWETEKVPLQRKIRELESNQNNGPDPFLLFFNAVLSAVTGSVIPFPYR
jgi:hypothetical protein